MARGLGMGLCGLLWGCENADREEAPPSATDPYVLAFADCTATSTILDGAGELLGMTALVFNEHGDPISLEGEYANPDFPSWTEEWTYQAPHQSVSWLRNHRGQDRGGFEDVLETYEWTDGDRTRRTVDDGNDGTVDLMVRQEFEEHRLLYWEVDLDGDGTIDDTADWLWSEEGEGWSVLAAGQDPNGPYNIAQTRDAQLRVLTEHYSDATGYEIDETTQGWGPVGYYTSRTERFLVDGELVQTTTSSYELNEVGRPLASVLSEEEHASGEVSSAEFTFEWSCP